MKRFNVLMHAVKNNRERLKSKEMGIELKSTYNKSCGRSNDNNNSSDSSGSEDSDSKNLEAYDGFAGGIQLSQAMNQAPV